MGDSKKNISDLPTSSQGNTIDLATQQCNRMLPSFGPYHGYNLCDREGGNMKHEIQSSMSKSKQQELKQNKPPTVTQTTTMEQS